MKLIVDTLLVNKFFCGGNKYTIVEWKFIDSITEMDFGFTMLILKHIF